VGERKKLELSRCDQEVRVGELTAADTAKEEVSVENHYNEKEKR